MAPEKKTEEVVPMIDTANKEVLDFAKAEDAEADRIFYEAQGLQADGKTPLEEEPVKEEKPEAKPEAKPEETLEEKPKEAPAEDGDLTKDLTVENADKRISSAQKKMHDSNKTAKDAVATADQLQKENEDLRKLVDEKATATPDEPVKKEVITPDQTDAEVDIDLENLRKEYPEIAEPMIKMLQKNNAENKALKDRIDQQDERNKKADDVAKVTKEDAHYNSIAEVHPDFNEISQEPLLDDWIDGLDPVEKAGAKAIQAGGETGDVIALLTKFKKANGYKVPGEGEEKKTPPNTKLEKAKKHVTPQFNKAKEVNTETNQIKFTQEQMHNWTEQEWADNEAAVDEALKNGQVR